MAGYVRIKVDGSEVEALRVDLSEAPQRVQREATRVLRDGAGPLLAREMKIDASGHTGNYFGILGTEYVTPTPRTSSEMLGRLSVEAGVNSGGSGSLMHILAYGSVNNGPAYDPDAGPRRAMPKIDQWLADAAESSVFGTKASRARR